MLIFLRLAAIASVALIAVSIVLYLMTGNRRYLHFCWRVVQFALAGALLFFALMIIEHVG